MARRSERVAALALLALLGGPACGGGSGSGGGGGGPGGGVSLTLLSPKAISAELPAGLWMSDVYVSAQVSGDLASLNGQTIYVVVEDPSSLFDPTTYVTSSGDVYTLHLKGKTLATAGHYVGSLKIHVSLDSAGTAPLGNTPLVVPYDVTVDPGLVLEPATVDVAASFGDSSTSGSVQVTAPGGSTLRVENPFSTAPFSGLSVDASNVLHFTLGAQPIGTYSYVVHVYADGVYQGRSYELSKDLVVNYTVAPNDAVDYVFSPSQIDFQWSLTKYGDAVLVLFYHLYPNTSTGVTVTPGHTVEFLTQPATADGNPAATHWWDYQEDMTVAYWDGSVMSVLPLGTYTARDVYTITKNGVQQTIYFPVTLEVLP